MRFNLGEKNVTKLQLKEDSNVFLLKPGTDIVPDVVTYYLRPVSPYLEF